MGGGVVVHAAVAIIAPIVSALFVSAIVSLAKERTIWRLLQLFGAICLIVVVLTHIAETFSMAPEMGWGLPNSVGRYLDFASALLGYTLLPLSLLAGAVTQRKKAE